MIHLLPTGWDGWDALRVAIVWMTVVALARMAARWRTWLALDVDERFLRLALTVLTASVGLRTWALIGVSAPGGASLVALALALVYVHVALHASRHAPTSREDHPHG